MRKEFWLYLYYYCCFINVSVFPTTETERMEMRGRFWISIVLSHSFQCDKYFLKWKRLRSVGKYFYIFNQLLLGVLTLKVICHKLRKDATNKNVYRRHPFFVCELYATIYSHLLFYCTIAQEMEVVVVLQGFPDTAC